tara:strand:- start:2681 stop:3946 length:1266 start_codon:yes stop_codon:yes gene_type:complete
LGCRSNQADSDQLAEAFLNAGFDHSKFDSLTDVVIVNTCTITHVADRKSRQSINKVLRKHPDAIVIVAGCYASVSADLLSELYPTAVIANEFTPSRIVSEATRRLPPGLRNELSNRVDAKMLSGDGMRRARPYVKLQDGCSNVCSFCIVPKARGKSVSRLQSEVLLEASRLFQAGFEELVLSGISLGSYLCPETGVRLGGLVQNILDLSSTGRVRLSSIEPMDFDPALFDVFSDGRVCPHFHIPLQSGDDGVLRRMRRPYTTSDYRGIIDKLRAIDESVAISTDVMVGYCDETQGEFEATRQFIREVEFAYIHTFPYSRRLGTLAGLHHDSVPSSVKRNRVSAVTTLNKELSAKYRMRFVGSRRQVLWENSSGDKCFGVTDNFIRVEGVLANHKLGKLDDVKLMLGSDPEGAMHGIRAFLR